MQERAAASAPGRVNGDAMESSVRREGTTHRNEMARNTPEIRTSTDMASNSTPPVGYADVSRTDRSAGKVKNHGLHPGMMHPQQS